MTPNQTRTANDARAKAEIAIEKILADLEHRSGLGVGEVSVDTQNFDGCSVSIYFREEAR